MSKPKRRFDFRLVVAWTWLVVAGVATVVLLPRLGLRGVVWLCIHDLLCLVGCIDEIRRAKQRAYEQGSNSLTVS